MYQFVTNQGVEIVRQIKKAVANLSALKLSGQRSWSRDTSYGSRRPDPCAHPSCRRLPTPAPNSSGQQRVLQVDYTPLLVNRCAASPDAAASSIKHDEGYINDELLDEYAKRSEKMSCLPQRDARDPIASD